MLKLLELILLSYPARLIRKTERILLLSVPARFDRRYTLVNKANVVTKAMLQRALKTETDNATRYRV